MKKFFIFLCLVLSIFSLFACGNDKKEETPNNHKHTYSEMWSNDESHHWHAATCEHTDEVSGKEEHSWNAGVVTLEPTISAKGEKTFTCTICNATKKVEIDKIAHEHSWDSGVVTLQPTGSSEGEKTFTCGDCGETKKESIAKINSYSNPFVQSDTNYQYLELDKEVYSQNDDLVINVFDTASSDYVAVFDMEGEPGAPGTSFYKRNKIGNKNQVVFSIADMELIPGEYCVCLYQSGTMFLYDRVVFKVSDGDATNYQVQNAAFVFTNNNNSRTSSLQITPSTDKEITYKFYWANDGRRLEGYSPIDTIVKSSDQSFEVKFKNNMYMPKEANQIEIYVLDGTSPSYFVDVNSDFALNNSKYLFNFQVFSDIHSDIDEKSWNSHFKTALIDVMRLSGNSSAIFAVGDLTNFGSQTCYELLNKTLDEYLPENGPKFYGALGNHEYQYYTSKGFDVARDYYFENTNVDTIYYSVTIEGYKFIVLGSESLDKAGYMSEEQFNWFKNEMSNVDKNKPTFIFYHQPLANTVSGMDSGLEPAGFANVNDEMRALLKNYPNAYCFSGHTHITYETEKTAVFGNGDDANFVNTGAIAYLNDINFNEIAGSLGLFVEVYEDYIMINGRNFYTGEWVAEGSFVSPIYRVN